MMFGWLRSAELEKCKKKVLNQMRALEKERDTSAQYYKYWMSESKRLRELITSIPNLNEPRVSTGVVDVWRTGPPSPMHLIMNSDTGDVHKVYYGDNPEWFCRNAIKKDASLKLTLLSQVKTFEADVPIVETDVTVKVELNDEV